MLIVRKDAKQTAGGPFDSDLKPWPKPLAIAFLLVKRPHATRMTSDIMSLKREEKSQNTVLLGLF